MPTLEELKKASQSGTKKVYYLHACIVYAATLYLIYSHYIYQTLESSDDDLPALSLPMPTLEEPIAKKASQSGTRKVYLHACIVL